MQIESVRLKNLNSLVGEWLIDWTDEEYAANGIFAILGPTGAGKSTILDAICLALFGRTPRLADITASENELMSRQTGECSAEIEFRTEKGRFRATWSQHRARKKSGGKLQPPSHEIVNAESGVVLEEKLSKVAPFVQELLGMNFEQLTRTVLLAQGDFDKFLRSDPDERSPILERITGTQVYTEISKAVFERQKSEKIKLDALQSEVGGIPLLSEEEERDCNNRLAELKINVETLQQEIGRLGSQIELLDQIAALTSELEQLRRDSVALEQDEKEFEPNGERIARSQKADSLSGEYAVLVEQRNALESDSRTLSEKQRQRTELQQRVLGANERFAIASTARLAVQDEAERLRPILQVTREKDLLLSQKTKEIDSLQKALDRSETDRQTTGAEIARLEKEQATSQGAAETFERYFQENKADAALIGNLSGLRQKGVSLQESNRSLAAKQAELQKKAAALRVVSGEDSGAMPDFERRLQDLQEQETTVQNQIGLLEDQRVLLAQVQSLEEHYQKLKDGEPCPLCGSREHPRTIAFEHLPTPEGNELELNRAKTRGRQLTQEIKRTEEALRTVVEQARLQSECDALAERFASDSEAFRKELEPFVVDFAADFDFGQIETVLERLGQRRERWLHNQSEAETVQKRLAEIRSRLESQYEHEKRLNDETARHSAERDKCLSEKTALAEERFGLFGEKDPIAEEKRIAQALESVNAEFEAARTALATAEKNDGELQSQIAMLQTAIAERTASLQEKEPALARRILELGFRDEAEFLAARLPEAEQRELLDRSARLREKRTLLNGRIVEKSGLLDQKRQLPQPEEPLETLREKRTAAESDWQEINRQWGEIDGRLKLNDSHKEKIREKKELIAAQHKEWERFALLNDRIGSADGKRYRVFAQGLTLDLLIDAANRQLNVLSNRYRLVRGSGTLEIDVLDLDQGGEVRTTKNLSGGESFLVSLALALGLSQMIARNVQVESFFLDEGFGTLDEETLQCALSALGNLRHAGKLIGIISHVGALKERIPTQIRLVPLPGGRSRIEGPGVSRF